MSFNKSTVRELLRQKRRLLLPEQVTLRSQKIVQHLVAHPNFIQSQHIGVYLSHENEVDLTELIAHSWLLKKLLYLPVMTKDRALHFYAYTFDTQLAQHALGVKEPITAGQTPVSITSLDLLLLPIVGFDAGRNRIGRGAGCYDQSLQARTQQAVDRPFLVGLAYAFQQVSAIECDPWDVPLDCVVTEEGLV